MRFAALHEIGHALGLGDSDERYSVMSKFHEGFIIQGDPVLTVDDVNGINVRIIEETGIIRDSVSSRNYISDENAHSIRRKYTKILVKQADYHMPTLSLNIPLQPLCTTDNESSTELNSTTLRGKVARSTAFRTVHNFILLSFKNL